MRTTIIVIVVIRFQICIFDTLNTARRIMVIDGTQL